MAFIKLDMRLVRMVLMSMAMVFVTGYSAYAQYPIGDCTAGQVGQCACVDGTNAMCTASEYGAVYFESTSCNICTTTTTTMLEPTTTTTTTSTTTTLAPTTTSTSTTTTLAPTTTSTSTTTTLAPTTTSTSTTITLAPTTTSTTNTTSTTTTTIPGSGQVGANGEVSTSVNESVTFQVSNFTVPGDTGANFGGIKIVSPETAGDLKYNGADVAAETECADVSKLIFTPEQGKKGYPYATFTFKVKDKKAVTFSTAIYTMTVNVVIPGDVDHNGKVTIGDVLRAFIDILDGKATLRDVLRALMVLVGKDPGLII